VTPTGLVLWPVRGPVLSVRALRPRRAGRSCSVCERRSARRPPRLLRRHRSRRRL